MLEMIRVEACEALKAFPFYLFYKSKIYNKEIEKMLRMVRIFAGQACSRIQIGIAR